MQVLEQAAPAGILVGSSRLAYRALRVPIEFLRPIPSVALIPLAVLVYGTGLESKVFLAVFASFWPLFVQTLYGVQDVDPVLPGNWYEALREFENSEFIATALGADFRGAMSAIKRAEQLEFSGTVNPFEYNSYLVLA